MILPAAVLLQLLVSTSMTASPSEDVLFFEKPFLWPPELVEKKTELEINSAFCRDD